MDDDELIAPMAGGDDTALQELLARHALAGGHKPGRRPDAVAGPVHAAARRLAGLLIVARAARITMPGPQESGRQPGRAS